MNNEDKIILDWLQLEKKKVQIAHAYHKSKIQELQNQIDPKVLRGKRKATRYFLENEFITHGYMKILPKLCTLVYSSILKHGNTKTQVAWPSFKTIQEETGEKNRNYIGNAVRLLVECGVLGLVQSKSGFKTLNLYYFPSVQYWKSVDHIKKRLKLTGSIAQYPNQPVRSIRRQRNRGNNGTTLTNQIYNSPNPVTSIGDILQRKRQKWQPREEVAIQDPSGHSVIQTAYEGAVKLSEIIRPPDEGSNLPANTIDLQENRGIPEDTTDKYIFP